MLPALPRGRPVLWLSFPCPHRWMVKYGQGKLRAWACACIFDRAFVLAFGHALTRAFVHAFAHALTPALVHALAPAFVHAFAHAFTHVFAHALVGPP